MVNEVIVAFLGPLPLTHRPESRPPRFHSLLAHAQFCNLTILQCEGYDLLSYPASTGSPFIRILVSPYSWGDTMTTPLLAQTEHRHHIANRGMSLKNHPFA